MKIDLTAPHWVKQNCTINSEGIIVENSVAGEPHGVYMELDSHLPDGTTHAVLQAVVRPMGRTLCWLGSRANNKFFMATFDLASGSLLGAGENVNSHSIINNGDGTFECRVLFDGTFPLQNPAFGIGAALSDQEEDYEGTDGLEALEIIGYYFAEGTEYDDNLGNETVEDVFYFVRTGSEAPLVHSGVEYQTDAFTAACAISWDGAPGEEKNLLQHWNDVDDQRAWRIFVNESGNPGVELSNDGTQVIKRYESRMPLPAHEMCLLSFSWSGKELKFFINDIELTKEQIEAVIDVNFEGQIHESSASIEAVNSNNGHAFKHWLWNDLREQDEIAVEAQTLGYQGLPGQVVLEDEVPLPPVTTTLTGNFPTSTADMINWLGDKGVSQENIRYVDNFSGNDNNNGKSEGAPWRTIQQAADKLEAGMAVIIKGRGGRFFEQVTPKSSGQAGKRIWFVGAPEHPPILDSSEAFDVSWTNMGNNRWRASYNRSRKYSKEMAYHGNCTGGACRHESVWMSHQLIFGDKQLIRISQANVPAQLNEGECFFEKGSGSYDKPQYVWCRLPENANPNSEKLRIGSEKKYLFDWSPHSWESFPGGTGGEQAAGRDHLGLVNIHFRFGAMIRKVGPLNIRGKGWHIEHCSIAESNTYGFSISGENHTMIDCKVINSGQGIFRAAYLQKNDGVTRFERCLFEGGNLHMYPEAWEAGQKFTYCGTAGLTEFIECMFKDIHGPALWWDLFNGNKNKSTPSYLIQRCIFEKCARNTIFFEHNSYNIVVEHSGIWNTQVSTEGKYSQTLAAAFRSQGAGYNTIRNNAIVFNEGKGVYCKAHDMRGDNNNDVIVDNIFVNNARNGSIDLERCEFYGGDEPNGGFKWKTSEIKGNVFHSDDASNLFLRDNNGERIRTSAVATFESDGWTKGSGNIAAGSASEIVSSPENRKAFWKSSGNHASKGPQNLVHFEDLPGTNWIVPQ